MGGVTEGCAHVRETSGGELRAHNLQASSSPFSNPQASWLAYPLIPLLPPPRPPPPPTAARMPPSQRTCRFSHVTAPMGSVAWGLGRAHHDCSAIPPKVHRPLVPIVPHRHPQLHGHLAGKVPALAWR